MRFIVYALLCPKCGCPRYVGKSSSGLHRVLTHMKVRAADGSRHKKHWVSQLLAQGLRPHYVVLAVLPSREYLDEAERFWIQDFRQRGLPLTNITDGGDGTSGWKQSADTIARRVAKLKGVPKTEEARAKISAALRGRASPKRGRKLVGAELEAHHRSHRCEPFCDQDGRVYTSLKEAAQLTGIRAPNICAVLKGRRPSTSGYIFRYLT